MVNIYLDKVAFCLFDQSIINIKRQIKSMTYVALEYHAYNDALVTKNFCMTTSFSSMYLHTHMQGSNPGI